jgi:hypothetical protein
MQFIGANIGNAIFWGMNPRFGDCHNFAIFIGIEKLSPFAINFMHTLSIKVRNSW